jgi:hypothetical protein
MTQILTGTGMHWHWQAASANLESSRSASGWLKGHHPENHLLPSWADASSVCQCVASPHPVSDPSANASAPACGRPQWLQTAETGVTTTWPLAGGAPALPVVPSGPLVALAAGSPSEDPAARDVPVQVQPTTASGTFPTVVGRTCALLALLIRAKRWQHLMWL